MKLKEVKKDNAFKNLLKACLDLADMADDNKIIYKAYNRAYNICKQVGYPTAPHCEYNHGLMLERNGMYGMYWSCRCDGCSSTKPHFDNPDPKYRWVPYSEKEKRNYLEEAI
jgi:hypothetical protein